MFPVKIFKKSKRNLGDLGGSMCLLKSHRFLELFAVFTYFFHLLLYHTQLKASLILNEIVNSKFFHRTIDCLPHFFNLLAELKLNYLILSADSILSCNPFMYVFY